MPADRRLVIEREVKLLFPDANIARRALVLAGAAPLHGRRLQDDALFDTDTQSLGRLGCALRIRTERQGPGLPPARVLITFKGPVQPGAVKTREEHETEVGDAVALARLFEALGLRIWFRYQKYREEFSAAEATVAIDDTPVGTFVEIEGSEDAILSVTNALGRSPHEFILDSYRSLFLKRRQDYGMSGNDMVFPVPA